MSGRTLVLGYHTLGCLGLDALLRHGYDVAAVFTHRDDPREEIWWDSLAARAESRGIPVFYPRDMRDPAIQAQVASLEPDFLFSFYFRLLLPQRILALARSGALNLHGSLLPKYRGRSPVNWVLVNGETETGVSLHYMTSRPDAGELVDQERVPIAFEETPRSLYAKLEDAAVRVLDRSLPLLLAGEAPHHPLELSQGSYFGGRTPEDGQMDWTWPARRIYFLVRGVTHPYPGAFTSLWGKKLYIWWGRPVEQELHAPPGTILAVTPEGFLVATAQGAFLVTRCQFGQEPEQEARAFCALHGLLPGARLGSD